jgi:tetratricopeptide (TPR) repeat protein
MECKLRMRRLWLFLPMVLMSGAAFAQAGGNPPRQTPPAPSANTSDASSVRRPPKPAAQEALDRAQDLLFRKKDPAASVDEFKKAVKADPWYAPSYVLLGLAYMQLQRWGDAQLAFEEATKVEPDNAQGYLGWGSALNEQKDYPGAQKALARSLQLNPESAEAHYELARTFGAMNQWQAAGPHAQRAIELNPDYAGPHAIMGNVYLDQQNLEAARDEFKTYLRLDPEGSLAQAARQIIAEIEKASPPEPNKKRP